MLGLDLGQRQDPSAALLVERVGVGFAPDYLVRWGRRWALGTEYGEVALEVERVYNSPHLGEAPPRLLVDATGVGAPVVEMLRRRGLSPVPVLITAGRTSHRGEDGWWHVPKKDLAASLALVMEQGRLQIARKLDIAEQLRKEMAAFRIKRTSAGNEMYEAWREGDHDDLVLALAIALWWGERKARHGAARRTDRPLRYAGLMRPLAAT